jgi:hypothetical protein
MNEPVKIDIIILSYAQNEMLKNVTENAIQSLLKSEDMQEIAFNVIVIETQIKLNPFQYAHSNTYYLDDKFGYHKFMNYGLSRTCADYVCICNNDLLFHKNWASEILKPFREYPEIYSASPVCSHHHPRIGIQLYSGIRIGYQIRQEVSGWCLFFRRSLLKLIGILDPNYNFWCADNDYINTLWVLGLPHVLVTSSVVDHLENATLSCQTEAEQKRLTEDECIYFDKKWLPRTGETWVEYQGSVT